MKALLRRPLKSSNLKPIAKLFSLLLGITFLASCIHLVSYYDTISYKNLTDLKAETLLTLDNFIDAEDSSGYAVKLEALQLNAEKAYQYERGKERNEDTITQLEEIREIIKRMALTFKEQGSLSQAYLEDKKDLLEDAFDDAIEAEGNKLKKKNL